MIEAELFDGTVLEFPPETPEDVIRATVKRETAKLRGGQPAVSAPIEQPSVQAPDDIMLSAQPRSTLQEAARTTGDMAAGFAAGVPKGLVNFIGLPGTMMDLAGDVTSWAASGVSEALGGGPINVRVRTPFSGPALNEAVGLDQYLYEPDTYAGKIARRAGEEVGAIAVPIGGAISAGARMGRAGAQELPRLFRDFVERAAIDPKRFAQREGAVATSAGIGAGALDPNQENPWLDLVGAFSGVGAHALGGVVTGVGKNVGGALMNSPRYSDEVVNQTVADLLADNANAPLNPQGFRDTSALVDAIDNPATGEIASLIGGFEPSLADVTANPGLASLEYARQSGQNAGMWNARRAGNNEAIGRTMSGLEPDATPGAFREALDMERERQLMDALLFEQNAADDADRLASVFRPETASPGVRGGMVREELSAARDAARERTAKAYEDVNVGGNLVQPEDLSATIDDALSGLTQAEQALVPEGIIGRVRSLGVTADPEAAPDPVRLEEAITLMQELGRREAAALADPRAENGGRFAARAMERVRGALEGFVDANVSPEQADAWAQAKAAARAEKEAFGRRGSPVADALAEYDGGRPKVPDEGVAGRFVSSPAAIDELFSVADTPRARQAIKDEVLASAGNTSDAKKIEAFRQRYAEQIARFPGLDGEIEKALTARRTADEMAGKRTALERDLGTPGDERGRGTVGRYLQYGSENSERAISAVLAAKDPAAAADELVNFVGRDPKALEGARAAFWQKLKTETQSSEKAVGGGRMWRGDWLNEFLSDPRTSAVAERLYADKPEHLENLRKIGAALSGVDVRTRARAPSSSGSPQSMLGGSLMTPETLQSRFYAYARGQVSGTFLASSIAAVVARRAVRGARADAINRLLDGALLEPELAKTLLLDYNPANRAAMARKAKLYLGNQANTLLEILDEEDAERQADEDPVAGFATR